MKWGRIFCVPGSGLINKTMVLEYYSVIAHSILRPHYQDYSDDSFRAGNQTMNCCTTVMCTVLIGCSSVPLCFKKLFGCVSRGGGGAGWPKEQLSCIHGHKSQDIFLPGWSRNYFQFLNTCHIYLFCWKERETGWMWAMVKIGQKEKEFLLAGNNRQSSLFSNIEV